MRGVGFSCAVAVSVAALCSADSQAADRHVPSDYATVASAVAGANAGDRIVLAAGDHPCPPLEIIDRELHFVGAGADETRLIGNGSGALIFFDGAHGSSVSHLTLTGGTGHETQFNRYGGAIYAYQTTLSISDCHFEENEAGFGGAIGARYSAMTIERSTFMNNSSSMLNFYGGGAIGHLNCSTSIAFSWFEGNDAGNGEGGAIALASDYEPSISHCVFYRNSAYYGGAIRNWKSGLQIVHCTFLENDAVDGSSVRSIHSSAVTSIENCAITAGTGSDTAISDSGNSVTTVRYSLVDHALETNGNSDSNIIATAQFISLDEPMNLCLAAGSPGVNAGDNAAVPEGLLYDFDGRDRIIGATVDMGAFETPSEIEPPDPTGACCLGVSCDVLTREACETLAGSYLGDDVACGSTACEVPDPVGACCHPDGSCTSMTAAECASAGGTYNGNDSLCAEIACVQPPVLGACCLGDASCSVMAETSCTSQGGTFLGAGASCTDAQCDSNEPVSGACCFAATGGCLTLDAATCAIAQGVFLGAGSSCAGQSCSEPEPCPADLDGDGSVGLDDLTFVLAEWGSCPGCAADLDGDNQVGFNEIVLILDAWGSCSP